MSVAKKKAKKSAQKIMKQQQLAEKKLVPQLQQYRPISELKAMMEGINLRK